MWKNTLMYVSQFLALQLPHGASVNVTTSFCVREETQETLNGLSYSMEQGPS